MRTEIIEELRVGAYPAPLPPIAAPAVAGGASFAEVVKTDAPNAPPNVSDEELAASESFEADDPHHPDLIISYDVINEEVHSLALSLPTCIFARRLMRI